VASRSTALRGSSPGLWRRVGTSVRSDGFLRVHEAERSTVGVGPQIRSESEWWWIVRVLVVGANFVVGGLALATLSGGSNLNPWRDLVDGTGKPVRGIGDYVYFVAFSQPALAASAICLALTTTLLIRSRDQLRNCRDGVGSPACRCVRHPQQTPRIGLPSS